MLLRTCSQALPEQNIEKEDANGIYPLAASPADPRARLAAFVRAALGARATEPAQLAAWAGFVGALHRAPRLRAIHEANYLGFRGQLGALIDAALTDAGRPTDAATQRDGASPQAWRARLTLRRNSPSAARRSIPRAANPSKLA